MISPQRRGRLVAAGMATVLPLAELLPVQLFTRQVTWTILLGTIATLVVLACEGREVGDRVAGAAIAVGYLLCLRYGGWANGFALTTGALASAAIWSAARRRRSRAPDQDPLAVRYAVASLVPMGTVALWHTAGILGLRNLAVLVGGSFVVAIFTIGVVPMPGVRSPERGASSTWPLVVVAGAATLTADAVVGPTLVVAPMVLVLCIGQLAPGPWGRAERALRPLARPADVVLDAFGGLLARLEALLVPAFRHLAHAITVIAMAVAWVLVVALPVVVGRLLGTSPIAHPHRPGSRWTPRSTTHQTSTVRWSPDAALPELLQHQRARRRRAAALRVVPVLALVAAVTWGPGLVRSDDSTAPAAQGPTQEAWDGSAPWYPEFGLAMDQVVDEQVMQQYAGLEMPDVTSRYLNIEDGWRAVWQPPVERCDERLVVWMFGGSTMFGELQRDARTLPSEVAKAAWRDGVALEVRNGGVHADTSWQQLRRLERALAVEDAAPDLVVFYDGFNDYIVQDFAFRHDMGGKGTFMGMDDTNTMLFLTEITQIDQGGSSRWEAPAPPGPSRTPDPSRIAPAALFQYEQTHEQTRRLLDAEGIAFVHAFQPTGASRTPVVDGDWPPQEDQVTGLELMRRGLPADIVDLSDALDGTTDPYFIDQVHTNEAANVVIGEALYDAMRPAIEAAEPRTGATSCR